MANFMNKMKPAPIPKPTGMKKKPIKPVVKKIEESDVNTEEIEEIVAEENCEIEVKEIDEVQEEVAEQQAESQEDEAIEENPAEEITDEKEETQEEIEEKPKKKTRKRKTKKEKEEESAAKELKVIASTEVSLGNNTVSFTNIDIDKAEEILSDVIVPVPEYWESEKSEIDGMLSSIIITEELDPTSIKTLVSEMSKTYTTVQKRLQEAKSNYESLKDMIDAIKSLNATGSSADERKYNATKAVMHYKKEDEEEAVDLLAYLRFNRERYEYYNSALKTIDMNRQLLITFSAAFKLELGKAF